MTNYLLSSAAGLLLALAATPGHATNFIGDEMKASWRLPTETSLFAFSMSPSPIFTVGDGVEGEAQLSAINFLVDFSVDTLTFTFLTNANFSNNTFNGIFFESLSGGGFGEVLSITGIAESRVHNMGDALSVNFSGGQYQAGKVIAIRFVPDIPEPASWAMMIGGLALTGVALRRRKVAIAFA